MLRKSTQTGWSDRVQSAAWAKGKLAEKSGQRGTMWGPMSPLGGSSVPWGRTEESDKVLSPGNIGEMRWLYKTPWTPPERPKFINSLWEKQLHRRVAMTCLLYDTLWIARPARPCSLHPQHPGRWLTALTAGMWKRRVLTCFLSRLTSCWHSSSSQCVCRYSFTFSLMYGNKVSWGKT